MFPNKMTNIFLCENDLFYCFFRFIAFSVVLFMVTFILYCKQITFTIKNFKYAALGVNLIRDARIFEIYKMTLFFYSGNYVYRILDMKKNLVSIFKHLYIMTFSLKINIISASHNIPLSSRKNSALFTIKKHSFSFNNCDMFFQNRTTTVLNKNILTTTSKRTMMKYACSTIQRCVTNKSLNESILKRNASYHADRTNVFNSTHEHAQKNPIIKKTKSHVFQHPAFGKDICDKSYCEHKICPKLCSTLIQKIYVGHVTHDGTYPGTCFLSKKDLKGEDRPQYGQMYEPPIQNSDTQGVNVNIDQTKQLNENKEMITNVHLNSSKTPVLSSTEKNYDIFTNNN